MRKTTLLILLLTACSYITYGQTKKDIIVQQKKTIDSLNLKATRFSNLNVEFSNQLEEKNKEISILKDQLEEKNKEIAELQNASQLKNAATATLEDPNEIYFEGVVILESMYDDVFYISVKIDKGELAGKTEDLYFSCGIEDSYSIDYTGNANVDGSGDAEGKKITGVIIRSKGNFENYETGEDDLKEIYRIKDLNDK
ncbi:MAG: hypothetical protein P8H33_06500 [Crocinitomicaceae bacterium]|nr:hypothetical protein [Crocinitomicaceae bacterium]